MTYKKVTYPYFLLVQYALIFMGQAVYGPYISIYLDSIGFSNTTIGLMVAIGFAISIFSQPMWGLVGDRAKNKSNVLKVLFITTAVCTFMYPLSESVYYVFAITIFFSYFQTSITPLTDAITLEYLSVSRWKYGPIRATGTIGFAVMVVAAGKVLDINISYMFVLLFVILIANVVVSLKLPKIKGYQSGDNKVPFWKLFKDRKLTIFMIFSLVTQLSFGYYVTFFPLHFKQIGGTNSLYGWVMFAMSLSEVPLLLFADKILSKQKITRVMVIASTLTGVRWLLTYLTTNPYIMIPVSLIHGIPFMAIIYSTMIYINKEVIKELRSTGQTVFALIGMFVPRIISCLFGGVLSDIIGIRPMFFCFFVINTLAALVFGAVFAFSPIFTDVSNKSRIRIDLKSEEAARK